MRFNYTILDMYNRSVVASENQKNITSAFAVRTLKKGNPVGVILKI